jgi:cyclase
VATPSRLTELAPGVHVWLQGRGETGVSNAAVVADEEGLTVIDSLMVRSQWEPFVAAVQELDRPVRRLVLTHAHVDHVGGSVAFPDASVVGTTTTDAALRLPMPIDAFKASIPAFADEFDDLAASGVRPVTERVDQPTRITPRVELRPATGHTAGDLVVLVPDVDVCFAGDLCFFGVTPLGFQGDPARWADTLDAVARCASTVVPGHGPVGGADDVRYLQAYLRHCVAGTIPAGPWDGWLERDRDAINLERVALLAAGRDEIPPSMLRSMGYDPMAGHPT